MAIKIYNSTRGLPKLQPSPQGTQNVDALSRKGERYSIKTISEPNSTTGVFHGLVDEDDKSISEKKFEYIIIVQLFKDYQLKKMLELTWDIFIKHKKWHRTMRAWNSTIISSLLSDAKIIVENQSNKI